MCAAWSGKALSVALALAASFTAMRAPAQDAPKVGVEVSHTRERLSGGRAPWTDASLGLDLRWASMDSFYARVRETERFGLSDREQAVGGHLAFRDGWSADLEATGSPTHHVLARYSAFGQVGKNLGGGWAVYGGMRHAAYTRTGADLRLFTLERYFGNERVAYTLYSGKPDGGGSAPSHRLQWTHWLSDRDSVGIAVSGGREVENVFPTGLVTSKVRSLYLTGRWWFARDWALTAEAGVHEQGNLYRRNGIRLGLRHQF